MANKLGYKSVLRLFPEASYGIFANDYSGSFAQNDTTIEMENSTELVDRLVRSGTVQETTCEYTQGKLGGTVSISGVITDNKEKWLLPALVVDNDSTDPHTPTEQGDKYSMTIIRDYGDGTGDIAIGCVLDSFEASSDDNFINFSATFMASKVTYQQDISAIAGTKVDPECEKPFVVAATSLSGGAVTSPLSFTFSVTNEYSDDNVTYGIGRQKSREILSKVTATLTTQGLLGDTVPVGIGSANNNVLTIGNGSISWVISTSGIVESYSLPDQEQGVYTNTYTDKLLMNGSTNAFSIVVS